MELRVLAALTVSCLWDLGISEQIYKESTMKAYYVSDPDEAGRDYTFGYSLLIQRTQNNGSRLLVGAPRSWNEYDASGNIFSCDLDLSGRADNYECSESSVSAKWNSADSIRKHRLMAGTSLLEVQKTTVACAPGWDHMVKIGNETQDRITGSCFPFSSESNLDPFYTENDIRRDYYYAMAGFSATTSPDENWLLLGAPGLKDYTGGVARYRVTGEQTAPSFERREEVLFKSMDEASYMGYSIQSAVMDPETNETVAVAGAPRSGVDSTGEVFIFAIAATRVNESDIRQRLTGYSYGEYFGASILATDVNGDGRTDLLVGAPNYACPEDMQDCKYYDRGAVYVFHNVKTERGFKLVLIQTLTGSGSNGAKFGYSLADLGDVDGDEYSDVVIGAPFESNGAVYIYRGNATGLKNSQQIVAPQNFEGFGFSFAKPVDIENHGCKDLVVSALLSKRVALFRCSPKLVVKGRIEMPMLDRSVDLCDGIYGYSAATEKVQLRFCLDIERVKKEWESATVDICTTITINSVKKGFVGETECTTINARSHIPCTEVEISNEGQRTQVAAMLLIRQGNESKDHMSSRTAYIGETSILNVNKTTFFCGLDNNCEPRFEISVAELANPYIPGTSGRLGFVFNISNVGENAFNTHVKFDIGNQCLVKKMPPRDCNLEGSTIDCVLPSPFTESHYRSWTFELDLLHERFEPVVINYTLLRCKHDADGTKITLLVERKANMTVKGSANPQPGVPVFVPSSAIYNGDNIKFFHIYEVINFGPSNWPNTTVKIEIPPEVSVNASSSPECKTEAEFFICDNLNLNAGISQAKTFYLQLIFDPNLHGTLLTADNNLTISTRATVLYGTYNSTAQVKSSLVLQHASDNKIWPIIVAVLAGLIIIALIVYLMYRFGFFVRSKKLELEKEREAADTETELKPIARSDSITLSMSNENLIEN